MNEHLSHLIFYDGNCGLCDHFVQFALKEDKKQIFVFAPLHGETAAKYLKNLPPEIKFTDSLILIENYRTSSPHTYILAQAVLRMSWLLGLPWTVIGWLSFFPRWFFNWIYRLVAKHRYHFFSQDHCIGVIPSEKYKDRFLP